MKSCNNCRFLGTSLTGKKLWKCGMHGTVKRFNIPWLHGWFCKYYREDSESI